jgi:hypothetical protein
MPVGFRWLLVGLMVSNLILNCAWDYFIVNRETKLGFIVNKVLCKRDGKKLENDAQHADLGVKYFPPVID